MCIVWHSLRCPVRWQRPGTPSWPWLDNLDLSLRRKTMADNMAEMGARMGKGADEMKDEAASKAGEYVDKAKEYAGRYAQQAKDYAQQGYDAAAEKSKQAKDMTQQYIEENPWYAIGIALGVGVLMGMMLRGSRD